ncbi:hypothetical protein HELRODRAFT_189111 [Helobdella robusta]|uniref:EGF-like domain-containing protein n=1 Tax=Helobdella robusta TaxID=6412 RepID=T1FQN9_HELRO|nr:hypothetical protein HELRODRAFT_189111 [Helobdella robusta]ESN96110.1 hypothetical protein HELRODRAFT_189111 [Helobdella robusta]
MYHCSDGNNLDAQLSCSSKSCKPGWTGAACNERVPDVCTKYPAICNITVSSCSSAPGSYVCSCFQGFINPDNDQATCIDIDECAENINNCIGLNETCVNTVGSYVCQCSAGYRNISNICVDIDECVVNTQACNNQTSKCVNQIGTFSCMCFDGFYNKDQWLCEDVNECLQGRHACNAAISTCVNSMGNYSCACGSGYSNKDQWTCGVSADRTMLFALIGVFVVSIVTFTGLISYLLAANKYNRLNTNVN